MINSIFAHIRRNRIENLVYLALWILIFTAPVMNMYVRVVNDDERQFRWSEIVDMWKYTSMFLIVFVANNILLNEVFLRRRQIRRYLCLAVALLVAFTVWQSVSLVLFHDTMSLVRGDVLPQLPGAPVDVVSTVVVVLLMGMNLGVKLYFKYERDSIEVQLAEKQSLEHQLAYLRYQVNPHFYMNTLNNIHALVDINPEKAKTTIVGLSKMMRYILYDANKSLVPLKKEVEFLRNYFRLMALRYTDNVKTRLDVPAVVPQCSIPPLLFIIFVENAFKHGISYSSARSFVTASISADDGRVVFLCSNSRHAVQRRSEKGGVGLVNVRKRLDLLYDGGYTLDIGGGVDTFDVRLEIPVAAAPPSGCENMKNEM